MTTYNKIKRMIKKVRPSVLILQIRLAYDLHREDVKVTDLPKGLIMMDKGVEIYVAAQFLAHGATLKDIPMMKKLTYNVHAWRLVKRIGYPEAVRRMGSERKLKLMCKNIHEKEFWQDPSLTPNPFFDRMPLTWLKAELYSGKSPREISCGLLTKAEADAWIKYAATCPRQYDRIPDERKPFINAKQHLFNALFEQVHPKERPEQYYEYLNSLRTPTRLTVNWLVRKAMSPAMTKIRTFHGPAGEIKQQRFLDMLDEIAEQDLVNGAKTSPETAFRESAKRLELLYKAELGESIALPRCPIKGNRHITQVTTSSALILEGKRMHHCVGGSNFIESCLAGISFIFHVSTDQGHSTVELYRTSDALRLSQHHGKFDKEPPAENTSQVLQWAKKNDVTI